ncbi:hypothetical protein [Kribbella sp. NPDC006257]|uniref:hypothetical protein n=1 Tax=Kribbella sp. NPDC006257 TaxID=3156738 RepID=UPI0033ACC6A8
MSELVEAITWLGTEAVLCLFVVGDAAVVSQAPVVSGVEAPRVVKSYYLDDPDARLGGRVVYEHDLVFSAVPANLESLVRTWLDAAVDAGAELAWFAFEGSFHFDHLLTPDVADQVYGIADASGLATALDDAHRASDLWTRALENRLKRE